MAAAVAYVAGMSTKPNSQQTPSGPVSLMDRLEETAFKWGGLVMIFLAVAFAMGIAIDHGLFTPPLRVAGGIFVGIGLIAFGLFTYLGRPVFGQSLQGAGLAVIFLSVFAGHQVFDVLTWETAMAATVIVTALSFWLAARRGDSALAAIGLIGGLAAPFVLSLGDGAPGGGAADSLSAYAIYATLLLLAALAVYFFNGWGSLLVTSGVLAVATYGSIIDRMRVIDEAQLIVQLGVTIVALALWLVPVVRLQLGRPVQVSRHSVDHHWAGFFRGAELGNVIWVPGLAVVATAAIWDLLPMQIGYVSLGAAVAVGIIGSAVRSSDAVLGLTHFVAASALLATASVLLLNGSARQLALAGQAFASLVAGRRAGSPVLTAVGGLIALPVLGWVSAELFEAFAADVRVTASQLVAHAIIVGFIAATALLDEHPQVRSVLGGVAFAAAGVWFAEAFIGVQNGAALTTASWILMAAGAASLGLRIGSRPAIQAGLVTVLIAVGKLLTADLILINAVGRTISFFVAGVVLVAFGYNYPAMREVLGRSDETDAEEEPRPEPPTRSFIYGDPQQ